MRLGAQGLVEITGHLKRQETETALNGANAQKEI